MPSSCLRAARLAPNFQKFAVPALVATIVFVGCRATSGPVTRKPTPSPSPADVVRNAIRKEVLVPLAAAIKRGDQVAASQLTAEPRNQFDNARESFVNAAVGARGLALQTIEFPLEERDGLLEGPDALRAAFIEGTYKFRELPDIYQFQVNFGFRMIAGSWLIDSALWLEGKPVWGIPAPFVRTSSTNSLIVHAAWPQIEELKLLVDESFVRLRDKAAHADDRYLVIVAPDRSGYVYLGGRGQGQASMHWLWDGRSFESDAPYFVLDPKGYEALTPKERRTLVLHEMAHVILARDTVPFVPSWVSEGTAMHFSDDLRLDVLKRSSKFKDSVTLTDLTDDPGALTDLDLSDERVGYKYALSGTAIAYLNDKFGIGNVMKFVLGYKTFLTTQETLDSVGGLRPMRELAVKSTEPLLQKHFGLAIEDLDREAKAWGGGVAAAEPHPDKAYFPTTPALRQQGL